jgi:hypothetical protein
MRPRHFPVLTAAVPRLPSFTMHMQTSFQTLQEVIPFQNALAFSLTVLVLAVTRLYGCFETGSKWYSLKKGNFSNWHIWICILSLAGSGGLLVFSVSKIYEKYQRIYFGLVLVNFSLLVLYEVCVCNIIYFTY